MHISWKSFFLSFGISLAVFSVLMVIVCSGVFGSFVASEKVNGLTEEQAMLAPMARSEYQSYLFYCHDKDGKALDFALLARVDMAGKRILVTDLEGEDLIERQGSLFYVSSLYASYGKEELGEIFAALTGYDVTEDRIKDARVCMPDAMKEDTVRFWDVAEILPTVLGEQTHGFKIEECPLVADINEEIRVINTKKSIEAFGALEIKNKYIN